MTTRLKVEPPPLVPDLEDLASLADDDPLRAVAGLLAHLRDGTPLETEHREQWVTVLAGYLGDASESIDRRLRLRTSGGRSPASRLRDAKRNGLLQHVWRAVPAWAQQPAQAASILMIIDFGRYRSGRWSRERHHMSAPTDLPAAVWWEILKARSNIPESRHLARVLRKHASPPI